MACCQFVTAEPICQLNQFAEFDTPVTADTRVGRESLPVSFQKRIDDRFLELLRPDR